jgi:alkylhydroperoxidase family enzyme
MLLTHCGANAARYWCAWPTSCTNTAHVSDELWAALSAHWETPQLIELLIVPGMYHAIAYVANGAQVALEEWAARFPAGRF